MRTTGPAVSPSLLERATALSRAHRTSCTGPGKRNVLLAPRMVVVTTAIPCVARSSASGINPLGSAVTQPPPGIITTRGTVADRLLVGAGR